MLTRTPVSADLALSVADAKALARIDFDDDNDLIETLIAAAAMDIESAGALALLPQVVVWTTPTAPGAVLRLPVGPLQAGADVSVQELADDGTTTTLTGWWVERGRWPVLHLAAEPEGAVVVTYTASLAATAATLPGDIRHAVADQVARTYDERGGVLDKGASLSPHAARVVARYRGVAL